METKNERWKRNGKNLETKPENGNEMETKAKPDGADGNEGRRKIGSLVSILSATGSVHVSASPPPREPGMKATLPTPPFRGWGR